MSKFMPIWLLALVLGSTPESARADEWVLLGSRTVSLTRDRDVIPVTGAAGTFEAIKVTVKRRGIHLDDLKVHFENGGVKDVAVRSLIAAGSETRVIDLPGETRRIEKITLVYRSDPRRPRVLAEVQVFGRRSGPPTGQGTQGAGAATWTVLGERQVGFLTDHDTIHVGLGQRFDRLKFFVEGSPVHMDDLKVHFANGDTQDVPVRSRIERGGESRVIDLAGDARIIKRVDFVYRSVGSPLTKATIRLFGRLDGTPGPAPGPGTGTPPAAGWEKLGSREVDMRADRDTILVTGREGEFRKIRLEVKRRPIHVMDLKVEYGNGRVDDIPVRSVIQAGSQTRIIDLEGTDRVIRRVTIKYESVGRRPGKALVELWGLH